MRPTRPIPDRRAAVFATACAFALSAWAARPAAAQIAGAPLPPPRRAAPPPVASAPARDTASGIQRRRDSALVVQRLDIQAWVDSAAPALARQPAAADTARRPAAADTARRPAPTPPRRPDGAPTAAGPARPSPVADPRSVAAGRSEQYLRPWPCPAPPSRSA